MTRGRTSVPADWNRGRCLASPKMMQTVRGPPPSPVRARCSASRVPAAVLRVSGATATGGYRPRSPAAESGMRQAERVFATNRTLGPNDTAVRRIQARLTPRLRRPWAASGTVIGLNQVSEMTQRWVFGAVRVLAGVVAGCDIGGSRRVIEASRRNAPAACQPWKSRASASGKKSRQRS